jgi:hypothetical protein
MKGTSILYFQPYRTANERVYYGFLMIRYKSDDPVVRNFWSIFNAYSPDMKKKTLRFITGSDRIPATGIQNMVFKITCSGEVCVFIFIFTRMI